MASKTFKRTAEDGVGTFFWPRTLEKGQLLPFRPGLDRSVDEICLPELVSVALDVLATGKTGDEVVLAMAKAVGLQRLRASSRPRLVAALARAKRRLAT